MPSAWGQIVYDGLNRIEGAGPQLGLAGAAELRSAAVLRCTQRAALPYKVHYLSIELLGLTFSVMGSKSMPPLTMGETGGRRRGGGHAGFSCVCFACKVTDLAWAQDRRAPKRSQYSDA